MSTETTPETEAPLPTFDVLPLSAELRRAIDELGYTHPTPCLLYTSDAADE